MKADGRILQALQLHYLSCTSLVLADFHGPALDKQLIIENHDLHVRFTWRTNDMAIWDK